MDLIVSIEKNGEQIVVGCIRGKSYLDAEFCYSNEYLNSETAKPISINLPLQSKAFSSDQTRIFFEALLPEGFTRRSIAGWLHVDESDYLSLLAELGKDCLGAIRVFANQDSSDYYYEKLTADDILALAKDGANKSAELIANSRISLAGATGKVGLLKKDGEWYLPHGYAPSNYIVKQSHVRLDSIVINEQLCQMAAQSLGIDVPESEIITLPNSGGEDVLFASRRYDRIEDASSNKIFRLHQEDFSQILGIPSINKYEKTSDESYCEKVFKAIRKYSGDPIKDQIKLWDRIVFSYAIGNADFHIKNMAMLYNAALSRIKLAPLYDCLSTIIYPSANPNAALSIGGEYDLQKINIDSFAKEADRVGLGKALAMNRFDYIIENYKDALLKAANQLQNDGIENAKVLAERILSGRGLQ